jgi:hypothetical protein
MRFKCKSCDQWHVGLPGWSYPFPMPYFDVPEPERRERCYLTSEMCVVDDERFFVRGNLVVPIADGPDTLTIGVWVEISDDDFFEYQDLLEVKARRSHGPYQGQLSAAIPTYPITEGLSVAVHINDDGIRPNVVILDSTHDLGRDQKQGLALDRIQQIYAYFERGRTVG